jgi:ribosomal protein S3
MQKNNAFLIQEIQKAFLKDLRKSFYLKHKYLHKGLKITVSGRIRGSRRKRKLILSLGRVTSSSLNKNLHS